MCDIAEFDFGENKKPPTEPFQNKRIRNPATARTVPSRMVCAPSFLSLRRRGMRLAASGGRSASPHPESRLLFTLCGFLRSFLSRTSVGGLAFGFTILLGERGERGERGNEGTRGTVAFEKAPQNIYEGAGDGWSLCKSVCFPMWFRPSPQEIVLGRLTRVIRRLFEAIAGYSLFVMVGNCTILSGGRYLQIFLSFVRHIDAPFAVSANPTKDHSKTPRSRRHEQSIPHQ